MSQVESRSIGRRAPVHFAAAQIDVVEANVDLLVVGMLEQDVAHRPDSSASRLDVMMHGTLSRLREGGIFNGRLGEVLMLSTPLPPIQARSLMLMGMGDSVLSNPAMFAGLTEHAMSTALAMRAQSVGCLLGWSELDISRDMIELTAAMMMHGALQAIDDNATVQSPPMAWTFDIRNGEAERTADALRYALTNWR